MRINDFEGREKKFKREKSSLPLKALFPNADRRVRSLQKITLTFPLPSTFRVKKIPFQSLIIFSEAESFQILQGESETSSASDNFQSLIFHPESSITQRQNACSNFSL